jgi:signal transduction histidine kinase
LHADAARLRLALRNLIDNALRHGGSNPPPCVNTTQRDGQLCISVRDFGPGVAPDELDQLSEAFYRPDASRQRATGGVGLGLHLCRLVAQAHGGALRIANAGPGLRVELSLPLQTQAAGTSS